MADTQPLAPTDAEFDAIWDEADFGPEGEVHRRFARAVLAKWGAQPVEREPLTDEQMYEERQAAGPQLLDLAKLWADNRIHVYQFVNEAEKIVTAVARRVEAAHGIKGGQHVGNVD